MLTVSNINVSVGGAHLLQRISFELAPGEVLAVIGPNGAGKSSLIRTIVGDLVQDSGDIYFNEKNLKHWPNHKRARHIALLPQNSTLSFPFSVEEVVSLARIPHSSGQKIDGQIVEQACAATDTQHLLKRCYTQLSGGEQQRVQLARVMAQIWREEDATERLLLLDEPTASLDLGHQRWILSALNTLAETGVAIVMVAHDISLAAAHADRILALKDGATLALGTVADVVNQTTMSALFDTPLTVIAHPETSTPMVLNV